MELYNVYQKMPPPPPKCSYIDKKRGLKSLLKLEGTHHCVSNYLTSKSIKIIIMITIILTIIIIMKVTLLITVTQTSHMF